MNPVNRMFKYDKIAEIEEHYNAKYIIDACVKNINGYWVDFPAAIFHTEKAHPQGSNYMAMYWSENDGWMLADGFNAIQGVFHGFVFDDGELIHSRYRHDYFKHRDTMVDGGREYFKSSLCPEGARSIQFKIVDGIIIEHTKEDQLIDEYDRIAAITKKKI